MNISMKTVGYCAASLAVGVAATIAFTSISTTSPLVAGAALVSKLVQSRIFKGAAIGFVASLTVPVYYGFFAKKSSGGGGSGGIPVPSESITNSVLAIVAGVTIGTIIGASRKLSDYFIFSINFGLKQ